MTESPFTSTAAPTDSGQADPRVDSEGTLEHLRPGDLLRPNAIRNQVEAATDSIGGMSQDRNRLVARGRSYAVGWAEIAMSPARIDPTGVYRLCNPHCPSVLNGCSGLWPA